MALMSNLGHSQSFFKPVPSSITYETNKRGINDVWLLRPSVTLTAMQINFDGTVKPLSSLGTGVSYSHFIDNEGTPYQNFGANLIVLFGTQTELDISVAGTISLWQYLNLGIGYGFMNKNVFLLTGITYNFN
jgi:hypothetical protein